VLAAGLEGATAALAVAAGLEGAAAAALAVLPPT